MGCYAPRWVCSRRLNLLCFDRPDGEGGSAGRASMHIDSMAASICASVMAHRPARFIPAKVRSRSLARKEDSDIRL